MTSAAKRGPAPTRTAKLSNRQLEVLCALAKDGPLRGTAGGSFESRRGNLYGARAVSPLIEAGLAQRVGKHRAIVVEITARGKHAVNAEVPNYTPFVHVKGRTRGLEPPPVKHRDVALRPAERAALLDAINHGVLFWCRDTRSWVPPIPEEYATFRRHAAGAVSSLAAHMLLAVEGRMTARPTDAGHSLVRRNPTLED